MTRLLIVLIAFALLCVPTPHAQEQTGAADPTAPTEQKEPVDSGIVEEEEVRLVILDVVVVDRKGNTVPDLTVDDFAITAGGNKIPVGSLDVNCPVGAMAEPEAVRHASKREPPALTEEGRRIVFALDYLHLSHIRRAEVLESAMAAVEHGSLPGDEVMLVALNGGLRIEQSFTKDTEAVIAAMKRMKFDITLWQPDYYHTHESVFIDPMVALLDLLGQYPGNKAVVLYSEMRDVPLDLEFNRIAAVAAASRCSIYPVDAGGLRVEAGSMRVSEPGATVSFSAGGGG
ncbi:MAG: VWA domain-containing protein [Acidobacteriota bacterium]|nr:VWA domain-containing protein [Acidobacteriota bacterium]